MLVMLVRVVSLVMIHTVMKFLCKLMYQVGMKGMEIPYFTPFNCSCSLIKTLLNG